MTKAYDDFLSIAKQLDESDLNSKDRKFTINKRLQRSLSDVLGMIELMGDNKLEIWFGDDLYKLTLDIKKSSSKDREGRDNE